MENKIYTLRATERFSRDLAGIVDYIAHTLENPQAAERLLEATVEAIQKRLSCPDSFAPVVSSRERKHPYYRIRVKKYVVFYVVIDDTMELRRMLYSRQDFEKGLGAD